MENSVIANAGKKGGPYLNISCPICEGGGGIPWHQLDGYFIDYCPRCKSKYVRNTPSEQELNQFYSTGYRPDSNAEFTPEKKLSKQVENWFHARRIALALPKRRKGDTSKVLEIGFGEGHLFRALAKHSRIDLHGLEYASATVEYHRSLGLKAKAASLMDAGFSDASFDMVVGFHVLEHTQNPSRFVAEIKRILKPGGRIFFVVPCATHYLSAIAGRQWKMLGPPGHLWYFSVRGMRFFLKRSGFNVLNANCISNRSHLSVLAEKPFQNAEAAMQA